MQKSARELWRPSKAALKRQRRIIAGILVLGLLSFWQMTLNPAHRHSAPRALSNIQVNSREPAKSKPRHAPTRSDAPFPMSWRGPVVPVPIADGSAPVFHKIPTSEPVVFLTMDDGVTQSPEIADWFTRRHLPVSMFLYNGAIKDNYEYFNKLQSAGLTVENHSLNHPQMLKLNLDRQKAEICGAADTYGAVFGRRPTLFRPPYGNYNDVTRQAAAQCGMRAIVMWHATVDDGTMRFQNDIGRLEPGDIVLMHFKSDFLRNIEVFTDQVQRDHLRVGRLEDWLK